jgi:isopenicillin N synthase-like dioxygenase
MGAIAIGLDLNELYFEDKINEQYHNLRLLSYPSIKSSLLREDGQARAGAHSGALYICAILPGSASNIVAQIMVP